MYTLNFKITNEYIGDNGKILLNKLAYLLEETAARQLEYHKLDGNVISKHNIAWVIVKRNIILHKEIKLGDNVEVVTHAGKPRHGMYTRTFELIVESEIVAHVYEMWVIMDIVKRALSEEVYFLENYPEELSENIKYVKAQLKDVELNNIINREADISELDKNNHINNKNFLKWANDVLSSNREYKSLNQIYIEYNKEIHAGEIVKLKYGFLDNTFLLKGAVDSEERFLVMIEIGE